MARLRQHCSLKLVAVLTLAWVAPALADDTAPSVPGLYNRPVLALDPRMHIALIARADIDAAGSFLVTGSLDKTVRVWSAEDGQLLKTIRLPAGPGEVGKVYAVAISPDGKLVAVGGWTRWTEIDQQDQIYLFSRHTGALVKRIGSLPSQVKHLTFSQDGQFLAATLSGNDGLRIYGGEESWAEVARDTSYGDDSYWADFDEDGRLATSSFDGLVRLYDLGFHLRAMTKTAGGREPYAIAFNGDGTRIAVGFADSAKVQILDGGTLRLLPDPDTAGIDNGTLPIVAWSGDGKNLFAMGDYERSDWNKFVVRWQDAGSGTREQTAIAVTDTIMDLIPISEGRLLVASTNPYLGSLDYQGNEYWAHSSPKPDFRGRHLAVSADGMTVDFSYDAWGKSRARFDVARLGLHLGSVDDMSTMPPKHEGLPLRLEWGADHLELPGGRLLLKPGEAVHSLSIHPAEDRFVLGTSWYIRVFSGTGKQLWHHPAPETAWAVNITGDGRLIVAAYGDGTIRWYRMEDGKELLAFLPLGDRKRWVVWTPEGYYASSPSTAEILGWHVNRGWDQAADFYPITTYGGFYQPQALPLVLRELDVPRALGLAKIAYDRELVQKAVNSPAPPGPQLHVLTIGISDYAHHEHLRLDFADDDARDIGNVLLAQEGALFARVNFQHLLDDKATRRGILRGLRSLQSSMLAEQEDVAVIYFSGHGTNVDGRYYLLPYDVETDDDLAIEDTGIGMEDLKRTLERLGEVGKVLVLLDACHSGNVQANTKGALPPDVEIVRDELAAAGNGVIVLTSSTGQEVSREHRDWENGAFTEAVLEALKGSADTNGDTWIDVSELEGYVVQRVRELTQNQQTPQTKTIGEHHFHAPLFVAAP